MIPSPGPHGGDGHAVARALGLDPASVLDLSATLNPFAPNLAAHAARHLDVLGRYPDHRDATRLLADAIGVDADRLVLTNGGSEAIALVAAELGGRVASEPEFALHPRGDGPVWRSDPHNPTGRLASADEHADVWDEAFYPLATGRWSAHRSGIVVGSLTKVFACPGLRLGYIVADDAARFANRQAQWPINGLAVALLPELLERADLAAWHAAITTARAELVAVLADHGIVAEPSDAPWVLAHAPGLRERLAPRGVVVRDCTSFGLPDLVRIAVPDATGLARLAAALERSGSGPEFAHQGAQTPGQNAVQPLDEEAMAAARRHQDLLTKPPGSLGQLEELGIQLAGIAGQHPPPLPTPAAIVVFAGDHGVVADGVTAWPQEVTVQMVANFVTGGAAINVIAKQLGASVTVIDVGVASDLSELAARNPEQLLLRKVRPGTASLATGPAMTRDEADAALDVGAQVAAELVASGAAALVTGDMGIGNTTASAALIAAFTGRAAIDVTGRGAGIDDDVLAHKRRVIDGALARLGDEHDPHTILAGVGGLEIAALAGFIIGAAAARVPVVVDGVVANAALLTAAQLCPDAVQFAIVGHRSTEPGAAAALDHLGLRPLLDLGLRLGEGSGAALALPLLDAAARILRDMATFDQAGVANKTTGDP